MKEKFLRFQEWQCECGHRFTSICYTDGKGSDYDVVWLQPVNWKKGHSCPKGRDHHFWIVFGENVKTSGSLVVWNERVAS
jgi:hypothetical protein